MNARRNLPRICWVLIFGALAAASAAVDWSFAYRPAVARYAIYGGELGDETKPSPRDAKLTIYVDGAAARDIFEHIGPDVKDACGTEDGTRFRERDEGRISCSRAPKDGYRCYFGFDLRNGKSIGGASC